MDPPNPPPPHGGQATKKKNFFASALSRLKKEANTSGIISISRGKDDLIDPIKFQIYYYCVPNTIRLEGGGGKKIIYPPLLNSNLWYLIEIISSEIFFHNIGVRYDMI